MGWRVAADFGDRLAQSQGRLMLVLIAFAGLNLWLLNMPMGMRE
jgi:hypothetical protein